MSCECAKGNYRRTTKRFTVKEWRFGGNRKISLNGKFCLNSEYLCARNISLMYINKSVNFQGSLLVPFKIVLLTNIVTV